MRKFTPLLVIVVALPALAIGTVWWRHYARDEAIWHDLESQMPSAPLNTSGTNTITKTAWLFGSVTGTCEIGHVVLLDGEVWRFAFASHHVVSGPDGYTVFHNSRGTLRARGDAFCCEIEFGDHKQPADMREFVALLRSCGDKVEVLR